MTAGPLDPLDAESRLSVRIEPGKTDLRTMAWPAIVDRTGARILSSCHSEDCDAYLLSESSLFVWADRFTMITCGQTHLLAAAETFLSRAGTPLRALSYVRRNDDRVPSFEVLQHRLSGAVYHRQNARGGTDHGFRFGRPMVAWTAQFYGLSAQACARFSGAGQREDIQAWLRDAGLLENTVLDAHFFHPVGYSINALRGGHYWTLHVTPESPRSYASFESDLPDAPIAALADWLGADAVDVGSTHEGDTNR